MNESRSTFVTPRTARWVGLVWGLLITAGTVVVALFLGVIEMLLVYGDIPSDELQTHTAYFPIVYGVAGLVGVVWGFVYWRRAADVGETHHLSQQTTPLPLHLVRENDDVWLEGKIRVPNPLKTPDEGYKCAYYFLHEEELQATSNRSANWITLRYDRRFAPCYLEQDGSEIELDLRNARFEGLRVFTSQRVVKLGWTRRRKRLEVLWSTGRVCASGVVAKNSKASELTLEEQQKQNEASPTSTEAAAAAAGMGTAEQAQEQALFEFDSLFGVPKVERKRELALREEMLRPTPQDQGPVEVPLEEALPDAKADEIARLSPPYVLTSAGNVALLVTPMTRQGWVESVEARQQKKRVTGGILLWFGLIAASAFLFSLLGTANTLSGMFLHGAILGTLILPVLWGLALFNRLVTHRTRVASAWAQIHVLHKARRNLFPSMLASLEAVAQHEQALHSKLGSLRRNAQDSPAPADARQYVEAEQALDEVAAQLRMLDEAYPALSVHEPFLDVSRQITAFEEKIAWSRRCYNELARRYNDLAATFPNSVVATLGGFREMPYWREDGPDAATPNQQQQPQQQPQQDASEAQQPQT